MSTRGRSRVASLTERGSREKNGNGTLDLIDDGDQIVQGTIVHLRVRFGNRFPPAEREDLAHEAYVRVLEYRERGGEVRVPLATVKRTAVNLALDQVKRAGREAVEDPSSDRFEARVGGSAPDREVAARIDLARAIDAASSLSPEQQAVYRALVIDELTPAAAQRELGLPGSTFFKYRKRAFDIVGQALAGDEDTDAGRERARLLTAYEFGTCTTDERARVRRLLKVDPSVRPQLVAIRNEHRAIAIALPAAAASSDDGGAVVAVIDKLAGVPGRVRDLVAGVVHRGDVAVLESSGTIASTGAGRGLGAAVAAGLAKLGSVGGAPAVVACVAGGGALIACVATGVLPVPGVDQPVNVEKPPRSARVPAHRHAAAAEALVSPAFAVRSEPRTAAVVATSSVRKRQDTGDESAPVPTDQVVEQSAPPVQQEFGVASAATPVSGAPPDTNDSNGAAASTVRGEFGP